MQTHKPNIEELIDYLIDLSGQENLTPVEALTYLVQETGELSQAVAVESGFLNKKLTEPAYMEAVDVIINGLLMYEKTGGQFDSLPDYILQKLQKWEKSLEVKRVTRSAN